MWKKGYLVDIEKSKQSISTYIKLYENEEQKENDTPVKEIRISDHKNGYGDKDVMLHYSLPIDEAIKMVDENISKVLSEEFKKNFQGVIIDNKSISNELDFKNLTVPEIKEKITSFYRKYLQTSHLNKNTILLEKEGIGQLSFSKNYLIH